MQARGPSTEAMKARGPSASARQARGPSAAARQARGPNAAARPAISLPLNQCSEVTAFSEAVTPARPNPFPIFLFL